MIETENAVSRGGVKAKAGGSKKAPLSSRQAPNNYGGDGDGGKTVEQRYQKKTQLEHILLRPDTYIGSTEKVKQEMWIYDDATDSIVQRQVTYVPGLYKIFDEIIVNAADNKQRDSNMSKLKVSVDVENGSISVWNDGKGIPIQMHREHNMYVPELIFGNLLTGSNFDDDQKKTTGGRNGFGAKLANIYSTEFVVETADESTGRHYRQTFRNNMQEKDEPVIDEDYEGTDFTCITFKPDWQRFHMTGMEADTVALLKKRVYDMAGCMGGYGGARMKVFLDKKRLQVSSFQEYMAMHEGMEQPVVFEKISDRWEVGVALSADNVFQQVSYVNAICTIKGGTHVEYVANQVINKLLPVLKRKHKAEVKGHFVKNHLCVFVNGLVENPAFNSQSKEALTSKDSLFGSVPKISDGGLKTLEKSEIVDRVLSWAKHKQNQQLNKKSGKKSSKLTGVTKLDDANHAGTAKSQDCTLILTEGDSAKTLAVSGLGVVGRDRYGVFPLKGKLLNVREASNPQVLKNEEIQNVVKILGLKFSHEYTDTKSLRYGHLMIMTDQDHDGSHIKGLLINFVHHYWPSLLKIDGFLQEFITPIVKVSKGRSALSFYTVPEYSQWKEGHNNGKGWTAKYYKGLGTSTAKEAKEYFAALNTHQLEFEWKDDHRDADLIDMAFSKKRVADRKDWLRGFKTGTHADYNVESVTYESFINKELILFSMEDNKRSIPCLVDGFKPSQRKVLFSCFKRNLKKELKVVQLAGYVSEHSAYHHGEASLNGTIIAMAQNYTGSNNLNLLNPGGQFGTRLMGGKDAASPRYIFTCLEKAARTVFHPDDDALLSYLDDDGLSIEPEFYMPVLPLILVNGSDGIGTGWSSQVPNYSPRDVIENLRRRINGQGFVEMQPWYNGFAGTIEAKPGKKGAEGGYVCKGIIERIDDTTVEITELPVRKWTQEYKQFLESLLPGAEDAKAKASKAPTGKGGAKKAAPAKANGGGESSRHIKDFKENHTDTTVHFTVTMATEDLDAIERGDGLYKFFKLESSVSTSNMVLFDQDGQLTKYETPQHIIEEFFTLRMDFYHRRKTSLLKKMQSEWSKLDNKVRFILAVVEGRLKVSNRKKADLLNELKMEGYDIFLPTTSKLAVAGVDDDGEEGDEVDADQMSKGYDYLLSMKLWSLTLERVKSLENELEAKTDEMAKLKGTAPSDLWLNDLNALGEVLDEIAEGVKKQELEDAKQRKNAGKRKGGGRAKGRGARDDDDSEFEDGPKKKSSKGKAAHAPPPPPPTLAVVPELVMSENGGKVSAAFAEAEAAGKIITDLTLPEADADMIISDERIGPDLDACDMDGDEASDFDQMMASSTTVPTATASTTTATSKITKKMGNLSLAERVRQKYGDSKPSVAEVKPKRTAAPRKPSAYAVDDSDGSDYDGQPVAPAPATKAAAPKVTRKLAGKAGAKTKVAPTKPKAPANAMSDSESEDEDAFDSDDLLSDGAESENGAPVAAPVARSRPGRAAALNRQRFVEIDSDEDEVSEGFESPSELEENAPDDYSQTPKKKTSKTAGSKQTKSTKAAVLLQMGDLSLTSREDKGGSGDAAIAPSRKSKPAAAKHGKAKALPVVQSDEEDAMSDDIFDMHQDSDDGRAPTAAASKGKIKGAAAKPASRKTKPAPKAKAPTKLKASDKAKAPTKGKGVKRGSRKSMSDEEENVFSPEKMSPPTKRVSQKTTPAASRLRATKPLEDDDDTSENDDDDVEEVTKTPRPTRRGRAKKVEYVEIESEDSEEEDDYQGQDDDDDDDDESEFEG